jgi:hypothetical protein
LALPQNWNVTTAVKGAKRGESGKARRTSCINMSAPSE